MTDPGPPRSSRLTAKRAAASQAAPESEEDPSTEREPSPGSSPRGRTTSQRPVSRPVAEPDQLPFDLDVATARPAAWGAEQVPTRQARGEGEDPVQTALARAAEADSHALMALFYFRRILDHQALSLLAARFRPLSGFFDTSEEQVRQFFADHRHLRGVADAPTLASPKERDAALRYAASRLRPDGRFTDRTLPGVLLTSSHPRFPERLRRSRLPVDWLFCYPSPPAAPLPAPAVAIIGSRESSAQQLAAAREVANLVSYARGTVITGLATGADGAAHGAAVDGEASLVGVLGSGARRVYPPEHARWVQELVDGRGLVLTEIPPDGTANADAFVLRNRIVAGLADIVVVVSGKYASGTAHTVRFAADMGVRLVSVDPSAASGITRLVQELGGEQLSVRALGETLGPGEA